MVDPTETPPPPGPDDLAQPDNGGGLDSRRPVVAEAPGKLFLILFLGAAFVFFIIYFVILGGDDDDVDVVDNKPRRISADTISPPPPPPPPEPLPPPKPLATPALTPPPLPTVPVVAEDEPTNEERQERLRSSMLIFNASDGLFGDDFDDTRQAEDEFAANDPNLSFQSRAIRASKAEKVSAASIGDINVMIAQGKLIHGVLETAINTQLPGVIRAITSRDIYAEAGRARLVPKGSRLIGVYNTDLFRGQSRVFIVWTRIIRPDGTDIMVGSPGTDALGRAGLEGAVDSKFRELFSTAILTSFITVGVAAGAEAVLDDDGSTTSTATDGTTTTSGSSTSQAAAQSIANIGGVGKRVIDNVIDTRPTISIDQGTKINIMVNRDLIFPRSVVQSVNFVE